MQFEDFTCKLPNADVERACYLRRDLQQIEAEDTPQSMLDMGTGTGSMAAVVTMIFPGISGKLVDVKTQLQHLELMPKEDIKNLSFEKWPCEDSLQGQVFDLVLSMDVLEHIPDWRSAVETLKKYVAERGFLYIQTPSSYPSPNWPTRRVYKNWFKGLFGKHNPGGHVRHGLSCKSILDAVGSKFSPIVASESYVVDGKCFCDFKPRTHLLLRKD